MAILIFIIILAVLVLVHELGHFLVAKASGIKVTEFGLGFPPRVWSKEIGETTYSLNAVPFGGFVKIFGENPDEDSISGAESARSIVNKSRLIQVAVLVAGVAFNIVFAWLLISGGYMAGLPTSIASYNGPGTIANPQVTITGIEPKSPALTAGIKPGDVIVGISSGKYVTKDITPEIVSNFIQAHGQDGVTLDVRRGSQLLSFSLTAQSGVVVGQIAIGIGLDTIGTLRLSPPVALVEGAKVTWRELGAITVGLVSFIEQAVTGHGDFSQVTGPVGIVGLVGDVTNLGFVYLLSFTALISLNLAVINLIPFPALDGGRVVVVAIEELVRRRLPEKFVNGINSVGFVLLILLMVVVTIHDVIKLF